jgi:hypothetical protein
MKMPHQIQIKSLCTCNMKNKRQDAQAILKSVDNVKNQLNI